MTTRAKPRGELVAVLRKAGLPELIPAAERELPDRVEEEELERFGKRHGLTKDWMVSRMGGSP